MSGPGGVGALDWEAQNAVSQIADAGMKAIEAEAERLGVKLGDALILLDAEGVPDGEPDAVTHPRIGSDEEPDATAVLAFACGHVQSIAQAIGVQLDMTIGVPTPRRALEEDR